jgi:6-phosphogluconolactonase
MNLRAILVCFVLLATMWLAGCGHYVCGATFGNSSCSSGSSNLGGGNGNNIGVTAFVYFVDPHAGQMAMEGLNVDNSENYASVPSFVTPTVNVGGDFDAMVVVSEKYLYLSSNVPDLYAFSINATSGALTAISGSPYAVMGDSLVADPNGKFLFAAETAGIHVFTINSNGSLTEITGSPFSNSGMLATQLVTDGLGKYLYAVSTPSITEFSYDQTSGALTQVGTITPDMSMIASEKSGKYILGITGGTAAVETFSIGSNGALTELSSSATKLAPVNFAMDPNGVFVYTFNQSNFGPLAVDQPMEGYTLESNGSLTALSDSPFTGLDPNIGLFDQSGEYLFTVAQPPNSSIGEQYAYSVNTSTGAVSNTLNSAGAAGLYVVTDAP